MTHNPIRPWRDIDRRKSRVIHVGNVPVGGDSPIAVQTMTNTLTSDAAATIKQVLACAGVGVGGGGQGEKGSQKKCAEHSRPQVFCLRVCLGLGACKPHAGVKRRDEGFGEDGEPDAKARV